MMAEYIEREAVRSKAVYMHCFGKNKYVPLRAIENAPAADVAPVVHAKWHDVYLVEPWIATGICSHCDTKSYVNPDYPFALRCPNCGARMDGD